MPALAALALLSILADTTAPRDTTPAHRHRISVEAGYGYETVMWRVGTQHDFRRRRFGAGNWVGNVFIEATAGMWHGRAEAGENRRIVDLAVTPVWQLIRDRGRGRLSPYMEASIGFHHISETDLNRSVSLGTKFQFGDHAGVGLRASERLDFTFRFQHLSNGGVRRPNHGVNFSSVRVSIAI